MNNKIINEIIIDGKIYKLESVWRCSKDDNSKDMRGKMFPFPVQQMNWTGQMQFIDRLKEIQDHLELHEKRSINLPSKKCKDCLLCDEKNIITKRFVLGNYVWDNGLIHYIKNHNIRPSRDFVDKLFTFDIPSDTMVRLIGRITTNNEKTSSFLKLEKNQLMILDALMRHGGYNKKYYDSENKNVIRYSEHAGFLDIREKVVHNVIVSGNTLRVDRGDEEIFLPINNPEAFDYEYIFHTHPPTPKPGGRAIDGILYEFPSLGDIFHFIDHYNDGNTIGSLVMTSEGLYNIRKLEKSADKKKININEDDMFSELKKVFRQAQSDAISKYGCEFSSYHFYSVIAQDITFITKINEHLGKYHIIIDFYPRTKDFKGLWIVDTIYIPIYKKQ